GRNQPPPHRPIGSLRCAANVRLASQSQGRPYQKPGTRRPPPLTSFSQRFPHINASSLRTTSGLPVTRQEFIAQGRLSLPCASRNRIVVAILIARNAGSGTVVTRTAGPLWDRP